MTDAMGNYVGGGRRYISPGEIQKMKKNMRKVPVIHEKGEKYHETETQEADAFINEQLTINNEQLKKATDNKQKHTDQKNDGWFGKILLWIRNNINSLYTLKQKH